ncbi:hypothetical protein BWZ22_13700 [Seonamhaeicola sp. S2-3]|nr:hypothetical protein BWZ22_13700 [Seonamhaeicola sp. S2-3]
MKKTTYIAILFILICFFACKSDKDKAANQTIDVIASDNNKKEDIKISNDGEQVQKMLDLLGVDTNDAKNVETLNALLGNGDASEIAYQILGKHSVEKNTLTQSNLNTLEKMLQQYPELESSGGFVVNEATVDIDFSKLAEQLKELDKEELSQLLAVLPTSGSNAGKEKNKNPFEGTFIEESLVGTSFTYYATSKGRSLYEKIKHATPEEAEQMLAKHYGVKPEEIKLLKRIEKQTKIKHEKQAKKLLNPIYKNAVEEALNNPSTSNQFKSLIKKRKTKQELKAKQFIRYSARAREAFYKLNPGWHAEKNDEVGNTYVDSRNQYIYLPLGKLSFADEVVEFDPGNGGLHPKGSLGEPNMPNIDFTGGDPKVCNIGLEGVLTLQFTNNAITDVNGPDLYVFEMGKIEPTILELSKDGSQWIKVGKIEGGTAMVDIADFVNKGETFTYVRLTDLNTKSGVPGADVDAIAAIGGAIRLNLDAAVLFEFGKYELKPEAEAALTELIPKIEEIGKGTIVVEGHTDNVGNNAANKTLSQKRAESVQQLLKTLIKDKVNNFKWESKGYGESQPVVPNDTDENRQKNRRVEILVLPS